MFGTHNTDFIYKNIILKYLSAISNKLETQLQTVQYSLLYWIIKTNTVLKNLQYGQCSTRTRIQYV